MSESVLEVSDLRVRYGRFEVVHGASMHVEPGEIVAVLGANGAGKSTLLKAISCVVPFESGEVRYFGTPVAKYSPARRWREGLRLVPEGRELFPSLTVQQNLRVGTFLHRHRRGQVRDEIDRALDMFPVLRERAKQLAGTLSGGEQQMLAIARALMFDPKVVLFDEISLGLAPVVVHELYDVIAERVATVGISAVVVEQLLPVARKVAGRGYVMEVGQMKEIDLRTESDESLAASYLGALPTSPALA